MSTRHQFPPLKLLQWRGFCARSPKSFELRKRYIVFKMAVSVIFLALSGCATLGVGGAVTAGATICAEPRPRVCTMVYQPVCAQLHAGSQTTYASDCNACADIAVKSHVPGQCEER